MFGSSPLIAAVVATVAALLASSWWFGVHRRRRAETRVGVQALAGMKWRECAGLVLQAMAEKGYTELPSSRQPGDGGADALGGAGDQGDGTFGGHWAGLLAFAGILRAGT